MLRGATEALHAIARLAWWERVRAERVVSGPRRPEWPALAADHVPWGADATPDPLSRSITGVSSPVALSERESLARLAAAGVPVTPWRFVAAGDAAADVALAAVADLGGGPVALKLDAEGLAHKTEAGGVLLGLADETTVRAGVATLSQAAARSGARLRGYLVEPMASAGVELIVGGRRDAIFGPVVLVGLGGILAEVLDDVAVLLAPAPGPLIRRRLEQLRGAALLRGVRGRPGVDLGALAGLVEAVGRLLVADPSILEIDLNPVIAGPSGAVAVDALVVIEAPAVVEPPAGR